MLYTNLKGSKVSMLRLRRDRNHKLQYNPKGKLRVRGTSSALIEDIIGEEIIWSRELEGFPQTISQLVDLTADNLSIKENTTDSALVNYVNDHYGMLNEKDIFVAYSDVLRKFVKDTSKHPVQILQLEECVIDDPEVEWLRQHTSKITAYVPQKTSYIYDFEQAFPNAPYKVTPGQWGWRLVLTLKPDTDYSNCPERLRALSNNDPLQRSRGALDIERGKLNCSAYVWRLVRDYPDDFSFSE